MVLVNEFGKEWELDDDESKGQLGLLRENHYRLLFAPGQRDESFKHSDRWLDIGANIGSFTIRAAECVEEVIAVEPDPGNVRNLERNMELNGVRNITIVEAAIVGGPSGPVELALSNTFTSTHRLGKIRGRASIEVAGLNINKVLEKYKPNKIKIDCEGTEAEILETMDFQDIEEIVFEYHFSFLDDRTWDRFYRILQRLEDYGFGIMKQPSAWSKTWHTIVWAKKE